MAQTGFTPLLIYSSSTGGNTPTAGNLLNNATGSELAINIADGKLFYKDSGGSVQVIAWKTTPTTAGGTGLTSWTAGQLPYYSSGTALSQLNIGTSGYFLTSSGSAPQWTDPTTLAVTSISFGSTGLTPSTATKGAVTVAGLLATGNGGTGLTGFTSGGVVYASSTSALATGSTLVFNGTNALGVGVTPNATWLSTIAALEVGPNTATNGGYLSNLSAGGFLSLTQNLINTSASTYKYAGSSTGSLHYTQGGAYYWQSAPSGTAGATATLTTTMSLSQAGVLDVPNRGISKGSMPAGSVLQVVSVAYSTAFSTTSATDVSTGLTASITPTSSTSKILVIITANCRAAGAGGNTYFVPSIYRNTSTQIWYGYAQGGNFASTDFRSPATVTYLDSPATTSSTNYLLALNSSLASSVSMNNSGGTSTITLMEIAA